MLNIHLAPSPMNQSNRIALIDTLRGIALLGIVAIHSMAHFSCGNYPPSSNTWLGLADVKTWETTCFLFEFKAFLLFSFLFGLSFFIQLDRAEKRGCDFRARFAWRLSLLAVFGLVDTAFFDGDILLIFAIAGFALIPLYKVRTKYLLIIAAILLSFPLGIYNLIASMIDPTIKLSFSPSISERDNESFWHMVQWNFTDGMIRRITLQIWGGRIWATLGLFLIGICAGRIRLFENPEVHARFFRQLFLGGVSASVVFYLASAFDPGMLRGQFSIYWSIAYTTAFVALVTLCCRTSLSSFLNAIFAPVGKMSLSCYISQSVFFTFLYAGWGLGMASKMGYFYSTLAGIAFFALQAALCSIWLRFFKYGPLEWLWRSGTMLRWQAFRK